MNTNFIKAYVISKFLHQRKHTASRLQIPIIWCSITIQLLLVVTDKHTMWAKCGHCRHIPINSKTRQLASWYLSVRPNAFNSAVLSGRIFAILLVDIGPHYDTADNLHIWLKSDNNIGHCTRGPKQFYVVACSTKYCVSRKQSKGRRLLLFHGNQEHVCIIYFHIYVTK
jgi:hypothetical protein